MPKASTPPTQYRVGKAKYGLNKDDTVTAADIRTRGLALRRLLSSNVVAEAEAPAAPKPAKADAEPNG